MPEHHFHVRLHALTQGDTSVEGALGDGDSDLAGDPQANQGEPRPARPGALARRHRIVAEGKPDIVGSSAKVFHGEASRWNPEELLIAALAQCHFLSFVYLASGAGIGIRAFEMEATGTLKWDSAGKGQMTHVELRPFVSVPGGQRDQAQALHQEAHQACFIARSVNFEVAVIAQTISLP